MVILSVNPSSYFRHNLKHTKKTKSMFELVAFTRFSAVDLKMLVIWIDCDTKDTRNQNRNIWSCLLSSCTQSVYGAFLPCQKTNKTKKINPLDEGGKQGEEGWMDGHLLGGESASVVSKSVTPLICVSLRHQDSNPTLVWLSCTSIWDQWKLGTCVASAASPPLCISSPPLVKPAWHDITLSLTHKAA